MPEITARLREGFSFTSALARLVRAPGRALASLGTALLPATCCLCGFAGMRRGLDLCDICASLMPANTAGHWEYPAVFSRALVPFEYAYPIDHFIRALKFRGERMYARVLGTMLADAQRASGAPLPQLLIPVPLHPSRYRTRGFNQAYEIACFAARQLGVRVDARCLARVVATQEQSGLPLAERQRNVRGAFRVVRPPGMGRVALVDDVLTTGNTVAEAAHALKKSGIRNAEIWCAARAVLRAEFADSGSTIDLG